MVNFMEKMYYIPSQQASLAATLHIPNAPSKNEKFPVVVICHGFVGSRIGVNRLFVKAANHFASLGFAVLRFDYEGCGESSGIYGTYGLDRFIEQTIHVIDFVEKLPFIDKHELYLLGHSLGGAVATLTAVRDDRVKNLAIWGAVGRPFEDIAAIVGKEGLEEAESSQYVDYEGYSLTKTFFRSLEQYTPLQEAKSFTGDVFVAHGTEDEVISPSYACLYEKSFKKRANSVEKSLIIGGNHTFSSIRHSTELFQQTGEWLERQRKLNDDRKKKII
ncbi:alpha/beta fold hydrolase [Aeribacillus pallidus]|uniref:alpha/beta hydrolase n=1 Tax=Aeribacillus sp. FSL K6-1305 TaxID=2954569 RepID=UPI0030FDA2FA